jgi:hypothetical protein
MPVMSAEAQRINDLYDADKNAEGMELLNAIESQEERDRVYNEIHAFRQWRRGQGQ